jgi:hypothetical protein
MATTLRGSNLDQQFAAVLAYVLAQEIETLRYACKPGFLLRQFQTTHRHEATDRGKNYGFQYFFRSTGHHEIIGIPDDVEFGRTDA